MKGKAGLNFAVTAVTLFIIFGFIGYLLGQYLVAALTTQFRTTLATDSAELAGPVFVAPPSRPEAGDGASSQTPAAEAPVSDALLYRVQVGVFSERANAERLVSNLKEAGYDALILDGPPYRVQTGAFSSRENAVRLVEELQALDFEAIVVR